MKKLFLFTWMMMLSIVAMAQMIVVLDKDGNRIPYDPKKVSSVDFQVSPPGFTVNHETASDLYTFDKVRSIRGMDGPRYIDMDWEKNTLDSYDADTGVAVITFADEVPDMDRLDCFVMPESQNYIIRVIESVDQVEDKTVTLTTSEGDMGNLFKDTQIVLGFGNSAEATARTRGISADNIIYPIKVELFDGKNYTEVYNANKAKTRGDGDDDDDEEYDEEEAEENQTSAKTKIKMDCELEDFTVLDDNRYASVKLDKFSYNVNLSGLVFLTFTQKEWFEFWKGELSEVMVELQGHRDYDIQATHIVESHAGIRDKKLSENDPLEPALASKTMIFTFMKDGKVVRASVKLNLSVCEFGYLAEGVGSAKTHIGNSTDFTVAGDNQIEYSNPIDDVYDTQLSMENAEVEGIFSYTFIGNFSINMFGEDVFNAEYSFGEGVNFARQEMMSEVMVNGVEGNSAIVKVTKDFMAWDVTDTDELIRQDFDRTYLIPYGLELNGKEKDIEEDINVQKSHKLTFHAYHQDHNGHRYDSKDAIVHVEIVSPSIIQDYYDVTDENGNFTMDFDYKDLDHGGTVTVTLWNAYYESLPHYSLPKRVWHFYPKGFDIECISGGTRLGLDEESVEMKFRVREYIRGNWIPVVDRGVHFTVEPGEVDPTFEFTNAEGIVTTTFKQDSPDFDYATLEATYRYREPEDTYDGGTSVLIFKEKRPSMEKAKPKIRILDEGGGTKPLVVDEDGNGEIVFVVEERIEGEDADRPISTVIVEFETDNKEDFSEAPRMKWSYTDSSGKAPCIFKVRDRFRGANIKAKATVRYSDGEVEVEMTVKVNPDGTLELGGPSSDIVDDDLKKADKLDDDTYVVDEKVVSLDGEDDEVIETVIENNLGEKITLFDWFKEHPVYYTIAWGGIYGFTDDMLGKEIDYLKEKANGNENLKLSLGAFIDPAGGYSETNVIEFNQENLEKAVFKMTRNADGTLTVIAYCKRKDGKVGMFKAKTKPRTN